MVDATIPNLLQIRKNPDYDNLRYADDTTDMAESKEKLKSSSLFSDLSSIC